MISSDVISSSFKQDYIVKVKAELKSEKLEAVVASINLIQKSIGWDASDLRIAQRRLYLDNNLKFMVKDRTSHDLIGYAILFPTTTSGDEWYISQIAVLQSRQGQGVGKAIMKQIFSEADAHQIKSVFLDMEGSDEKLLNFYRSFEVKSVKELDLGRNRFGEPKKRFVYTS